MIEFEGKVHNMLLDVHRERFYLSNRRVIWTAGLHDNKREIFMGQMGTMTYTAEGSGEDMTFNYLDGIEQISEKYLICFESSTDDGQERGPHISLIDIDARNKTYLSGLLNVGVGDTDGDLKEAQYAEWIPSFTVDVKNPYQVLFVMGPEWNALKSLNLITNQVKTLVAAPGFSNYGYTYDIYHLAQNPVSGDIYVTGWHDYHYYIFDYAKQDLRNLTIEPSPIDKYMKYLMDIYAYTNRFMFIGGDYLVLAAGDTFSLVVWDIKSDWEWTEICTPTYGGYTPGNLSTCHVWETEDVVFYKGDLYVLSDRLGLVVFRGN